MIDDGMVLRSHRALSVQAVAARLPGRLKLGATAAVALERADRFLATEAAFVRESGSAGEASAPCAACEQFVSAYDTARTVVMARLRSEAIGAESPALRDAEALLDAAEHLEALLHDHDDEGWTRLLLEVLSPALDAAAREWASGLAALGPSAHAREALSVAAAAFDDAFVRLRRLVRADLGRWSDEYLGLCSRPDDSQETV